MDFKEDYEKLKSLPRDKYMEVLDILYKNIWEYGGGIQFTDIIKVMNTPDEDLNKDDFSIGNGLITMLDSDKKIKRLIMNDNENYTSEESETFIKEVKASNITDISDSGYFYKKLAIALDNTKVIEDDCGSQGVEFRISNGNKFIDKDSFDYKIKDMNFKFNLEDNDFFNFNNFKDFSKEAKKHNNETIFIRTPSTCSHNKKHCYCDKCVGRVNSGGRELNKKNIGLLTVLAVTETSTQASLSSMNKGTSEGVNKILEKKIECKGYTWEDYMKSIDDIIDRIGYIGIQSRWYEISLIARIFEKEDGKCFQTSFISTPKYFEDKFANFIFSPTVKNLQKIIKNGTTKINSEKSKMLFDTY